MQLPDIRTLLTDMLERRNGDSEWQRWWAWHPVTIKDRKVWLRTVYRKKQWRRAMDPEDAWYWYYTDNLFDIISQIK